MNISPSLTETVSLSASAGALDEEEVGAAAEVLASALLEGALLVGAASVASSSAEQPLTRPIPRARTSGATRRAERAELVAWDTRDLLAADGTTPRWRLPVAGDAATLTHPRGTP
jgi:hypothetical protein